MESNETTTQLLGMIISNWSSTTTTTTLSPSPTTTAFTPTATSPPTSTSTLISTTLLSALLSTTSSPSSPSPSSPSPSPSPSSNNQHYHHRNLSLPHKVTAFSPAVVHFTYYELNFYDIIFFACVFFLKFFITSLFLIFALVAINGNSYPGLIARSTEAHRLVANSYDNSNGNGSSNQRQNRRQNKRRHHHRDLIYTMAALSILSGNVSCLLGYIAALQRFIFILSWNERAAVIKKHFWRSYFSVLSCCREPTGQRTQLDSVDLEPPTSAETPARPLIPTSTSVVNGGISVHFSPKHSRSFHQEESGRLTPRVVFIDSEPDIETSPNPLERIPTPPPPQSQPSASITIEPTGTGSTESPPPYSPVLRLRVLNPLDGTSLLTRARLDPHSICSYISPTIVTTLRMRRHFIWPVFFRPESSGLRKSEYVYQATTAVLQSTEPAEEITGDITETFTSENEGSRRGSALNPRSAAQLSSEPVELLIPSQSKLFPPAPKPGSWIAFLARNTCGIGLSDAPEVGENDAQENSINSIGLIIGQDLLYRLLLPGGGGGQLNSQQHLAYLVGRELLFIRTTFGWTVSGSSQGLSLGTELKVRQIETAHLGIVDEEEGERPRRRSFGCSETMRLLCCPLQVLVSLLVLLIYILIPYLDALLYLYNLLFHLAITFALAQLLAVFLLGPILTLVQMTLSGCKVPQPSQNQPNRPPTLLAALKRNILSTYSVLSKPLLLLYRWHLAAVWVSLYWFLSMGRALFAAWNGGAGEGKAVIRFSANFTVKSVDSFGGGGDGDTEHYQQNFLSPSIHVRLEPAAERSSLSADLLDSETFHRLLGECCSSGGPRVNRPRPNHRTNGTTTPLLPALKDPTSLPVQLTADRELVFSVVEPDHPGDLQRSWICLGADFLEAAGAEPTLNRLLRSMLLLDIPNDKPNHDPNPSQNSQSSPRPLSVCLEKASEPTGPWALEHRFYPHGWLQVLSCAYWFRRPHLAYLPFFLAYSLLLAVVYFTLIAPHELTLLSLRPTMFRYIGNFLLYSVRWGSAAAASGEGS